MCGRSKRLAAALADADILIAALGDERQTVTAAAIKQALRARRQRPMICIDSAVPGDIEAAVHDLDGAFRFDLGDLERLAVEGQSSRAAAADPAWAIVEAEVAAFAAGDGERQAVPAVVALRRHFETVRDQVRGGEPRRRRGDGGAPAGQPAAARARRPCCASWRPTRQWTAAASWWQ